MRPIILLACLAVAACARPNVDTATANYTQVQYDTDLDACRGGNALTAAAKGAGGMVVGSLYGFFPRRG